MITGEAELDGQAQVLTQTWVILSLGLVPRSGIRGQGADACLTVRNCPPDVHAHVLPLLVLSSKELFGLSHRQIRVAHCAFVFHRLWFLEQF